MCYFVSVEGDMADPNEGCRGTPLALGCLCCSTPPPHPSPVNMSLSKIRTNKGNTLADCARLTLLSWIYLSILSSVIFMEEFYQNCLTRHTQASY